VGGCVLECIRWRPWCTGLDGVACWQLVSFVCVCVALSLSVPLSSSLSLSLSPPSLARFPFPPPSLSLSVALSVALDPFGSPLCKHTTNHATPRLLGLKVLVARKHAPTHAPTHPPTHPPTHTHPHTLTPTHPHTHTVQYTCRTEWGQRQPLAWSADQGLFECTVIVLVCVGLCVCVKERECVAHGHGQGGNPGQATKKTKNEQGTTPFQPKKN
jgi:hypothetical protein